MEIEKDQRTCICWLTPQKPERTGVRTGLGQSVKSGTQPRSSLWVEEDQQLEPSLLTGFALAGSWISELEPGFTPGDSNVGCGNFNY